MASDKKGETVISPTGLRPTGPWEWSSIGGPFQFRIIAQGEVNKREVKFMRETAKLAFDVLEKAAENRRFSGFDGIELNEERP